jgi:flagellum-specific ATP synthase
VKPHHFLRRIEQADLVQSYGFVTAVAAGLIRASGPNAAPGSLCTIGNGEAGSLLAEVVSVDERGLCLMPLAPVEGLRPGARVVLGSQTAGAPVGDCFGGRIVNALGAPLDGGPAMRPDAELPLAGSVPRPLDRKAADAPLRTGLRVLDGLLPLSEGQRVGIFAASGVGKTSLVEQLAAQVPADRCILCLVGERGREVEAMGRFIRARGDAHRFTIVSATSDESAALRARATNYALALAEFWRAQGEHVLLIVDSVTRFAMALREVGLAAGAPPTVRAYTPNVFAALPRLVERCGALAAGGAITAVMTVLSETDDVDDPIVEVMKSLLDGHIVLSRLLAEQGHFPAVDVTRSVSRGADRLVGPQRAELMAQAVAMLSAYEESRIMIESGVYKAGTNPALDRAIRAREPLMAFLKQGRDEVSGNDETGRALAAIVRKAPQHA